MIKNSWLVYAAILLIILSILIPSYFIVGQLFSWLANMLMFLILLRIIPKFKPAITIDFIEQVNKVILCLATVLGVQYLSEFLHAWIDSVGYEAYSFSNRAFGPYWWAYWSMMICNIIAPQLFWFKKIRRNVIATFLILFFMNIGMWFERFVIIITSMHRDYLPSSWVMYSPTFFEIQILVWGLALIGAILFLMYKNRPKK